MTDLHYSVALSTDCFVQGILPGDNPFAQARYYRSFGRIGPAFAKDQVRLQTESFQNTGAGLLSLLKLAEEAYVLGQYNTISFIDRRQNGTGETQTGLWETAPYRVYRSLQGGCFSTELRGLMDVASCVFDFDVSHLNECGQLLRWNLLNAVGPLVADHARRYFHLRPTKRFQVWQYCAERERLPLGWQWQPNPEAYLKHVHDLTQVFALQEERAEAGDMLATGVFHLAQLIKLGERTVVRFWPLPTMSPAQMMQCLKWIDEWLVEAVRRLQKQAAPMISLQAAADYLPLYRGGEVPLSDSGRLYWLEGS